VLPDLDRFAKFCRDVLTTEDGTRLELEPFQRTMFSDLFAGVRETVILIPKKNGKSTALGALALFHLITTPDAECVIAAASRDQAAIMLRQAQGFIRRSPSLRLRLQVKQREIVHLRHGGRVRVLASDVDTADGVIPTLALVDELHRHKSSELYGVFLDGLGPREGQIVTISTAGASHDTPLGELRRNAYAFPGIVRDGAYRYVRADAFAMHEWALEPDEPWTYTDDDPEKARRKALANVKLANPASWQTVAVLRERHDSPSMTPGQWARFACGIWDLGSDPAFDGRTWDSLAKLDEQPAAGRKITAGFDGARRRDGTAIVGCDLDTGHLFVLGYWQRPANASDDWEVPEQEVDEVVDHMYETWEVVQLYGDPPFWESALDRWAGRYGERRVVRWWTNRIKATAIALRAFANDMDPERMSHDGDTKLAEHIRNAVRHETKMRENDEALWVIRKDSRDSPRKIDLAMAAMLAWKARGDAIAKGALDEPVYETAQW
jgi:phage terminase large subunit-like protein